MSTQTVQCRGTTQAGQRCTNNIKCDWVEPPPLWGSGLWLSPEGVERTPSSGLPSEGVKLVPRESPFTGGFIGPRYCHLHNPLEPKPKRKRKKYTGPISFSRAVGDRRGRRKPKKAHPKKGVSIPSVATQPEPVEPRTIPQKRKHLWKLYTHHSLSEAFYTFCLATSGLHDHQYMPPELNSYIAVFVKGRDCPHNRCANVNLKDKCCECNIAQNHWPEEVVCNACRLRIRSQRRENNLVLEGRCKGLRDEECSNPAEEDSVWCERCHNVRSWRCQMYISGKRCGNNAQKTSEYCSAHIEEEIKKDKDYALAMAIRRVVQKGEERLGL